jgi:hypothetical protein
MTIAFLTLDEVNSALAEKLACDRGVDIRVFFPNDLPPNARFDRVLYDLDYWPTDRAEQLLRKLMHRPSTTRVGVLSYNLTREQITSLRGNGVMVFERLSEKAMQTFCRERNPKSEPQSRSKRSGPAIETNLAVN